MTLKTIETFITTVAPNKATVVSFPEFIAIFGGAISPKKKTQRIINSVIFWIKILLQLLRIKIKYLT